MATDDRYERRLRARFWGNVAIRGPDDCWEWQASTTQGGYGNFGVGGGRNARAHRLSWEWANGRSPGDLCVCHSCDNPSCVNPAHLWLGTQAENMRDRDCKGRGGQISGEGHPKAKLSDYQRAAVPALYEKGWLQSELAAAFGVSPPAIRYILKKHREKGTP